jgi:hypothetical protein
MKKRWLLIISVGAVMLLCWGPVGWLILFFGVNNNGSPALAREWKDELAPFADPESAKAKYPQTDSARFENGEWVFGLSQDSHGLFHRGGGTVVVKDSCGSVRAFFGHVCGAHWVRSFDLEHKSLNEFYAYLRDCGFVEYHWPENSGKN